MAYRAAAFAALAGLAAACASAIEDGNTWSERIAAEASVPRGQAPRFATLLAERYGPRLTGSPSLESAAQWIVRQGRAWNIPQVRIERWGRFGRAWTLRRPASVKMTQAEAGGAPLVSLPAVALAWSGSTPRGGTIAAHPLLWPIDENDLDSFAQRLAALEQAAGATGGVTLRGRALMMADPGPLAAALAQPEPPPAPREYTDSDLVAEATAPEKPPRLDYTRLALPAGGLDRAEFLMYAPPAFLDAFAQRQQELRRRLHDLLRRHGAAAVLTSSAANRGGRIVATHAGWWQASFPAPLPVLALDAAAYLRLAAAAASARPAQLAIRVDARSSAQDVTPPIAVAELPGQDPALRASWVLAGAHLDSWTAGAGAADNAAGCAVLLEALRILRHTRLPLRRSVRLLWWSGEEQGNLASRAYVERLKAAGQLGEVAAYFNLDDGAGRIRGIYTYGNQDALPRIAAWLAGAARWGAATVSPRLGGLSDASPFAAAAVPTFSFIQDPLDYWDRTHHSNLDTAARLDPAHLRDSAAALAWLLWKAANDPAPLPRTPAITRVSPLLRMPSRAGHRLDNTAARRP